jgi:hypothetical protein
MKISIIKSVLMGAALMGAVNFGTNSVRADQTVGTDMNMPIQVTANINETGCNNNPGPYVTIDGTIALGGLKMQLTFANNVKGTHTTVVTLQTNITLIDLGEKITIPKQPVRGGVGGNPLIWIQYFNKDGDLSDEIFLGRCVQGLKLQNNFLNPSTAAALIRAAGCENNPGPYITIGGGLNLSGLNARIIFRNNVKGTHTAESTANVTIVGNGTLVKIPKQPVLGGSGGNPLVWVQFLQSDGTPIGQPQFLGRCNKI